MNFNPSDFPGSPYATELRRGLNGLRFSPPLEQEFIGHHLQQVRTRVRIFHALALGVITAGTVAQFLTTGLRSFPTLLHLGAILPAAITMVWVAWSPGYERRYLPFARALVPLINSLVIMFCAQAAAHGHPERLAYVATNLITVFFLTGLLFRSVVFTTGSVVSGFLLAAGISGLSTHTLVEFSCFLALTGVTMSVVHHGIELSNRKSFLEGRLVSELAARDGLTGLLNRRSFDEHLARAWQQGARDRKSLALLLVDVDYFKRYNDRFGHLAGDDALRRVGHIVKRLARRPLDLAARYGGEEFVVVLYDLSADHVLSIAERLRRAVERLHRTYPEPPVASQTCVATTAARDSRQKSRLLAAGTELLSEKGPEAAFSNGLQQQFLTVSVGVALVEPVATRSARGLVQLADEALYAAKESGRNHVSFKGPDDYRELKTGSFPTPAFAQHA